MMDENKINTGIWHRFGRATSLLMALPILSGFASFATQAQPKIELQGAMSPLFGISSNQNHGFMTDVCGFRHVSQGTVGCGTAEPYGAWVDGPMNPYKYGGDTYFQIPMSENHRIKIPNHYWGGPTTWTMEPAGTSPPGMGASMTPAQRD